MGSRLDLLTLKLLAATIEEKSFARAAERHNIAISALSKRISDFEASFKVQLLQRQSKGIEPTAAGLAVLAHARIIARDVAQLEDELREYTVGVRGQVRICANETMAFGSLPEDINGFMQENPRIRVDFRTATNRTVVQSVLDHTADIGIFAGNTPSAEIKAVPYRADRLVVLVPRDHTLAGQEKVHFSELMDYEIIEHEKGSVIETYMLHAASELGRPLRTRIRVSTLDTACRMVEAGLGIVILADQYAIRLASVMKVISIALEEPWAARQHKIGVRRHSEIPVAASLLFDHLRACGNS